MLDSLEKLLARTASVIGIIFAIAYWAFAKNPFFNRLLCQYSLLFAAVLLIILIFYILLIRAVLKHIIMMRQAHVHHSDEKMNQTDYSAQYAAVLFEALLVSLIMIVTIGGYALSSASCALQSFF